MSGSMAGPGVKVGLVPRSSLSMAHDYLRMRFHENGGSAATASYALRLAGVESTGTYTVNGTTTNTWDNTGYITPFADNNILFDDQSLDPLFRLDTLTSGGLLIMATILKTVEQTGTRHVIQYGASSRTSPGGIVFDISSNPNLLVSVSPSTTGESVSFASKSIADAGDITLCGYIDVANGSLYAAKLGDFAGAANDGGALAAITAAGLLPSTTDGNFGVSFMAGHNAAADTTSNNLNETTGDLQLRDLWVVRLETDYLASIGAIFTEYHSYSYENLRTLSA